MNGPGFGFGWGLHALVLFGIVVLWLLVIAGILVALYFVVRLAVTHGIRAEAERDGRPHHPTQRPTHAAPGAAAQAAPAHAHQPGTVPSATGPDATPVADRRNDPRPPDVAA